MTDDLTAELTALEKGFWEASTDPGFFGEHLADEAVMVFPYGVGAMDKAMVLYTIRANAEEWASVEFADARVVRLGEDAAVITYKVTAERNDDEPFKAFTSSTFVRRDGRWLLAFHQQTLASTGK
ncbi:MAG: nuclear transport factor 2 family protein [Actinobacteria bacterium]|nr:nuclear transport factor 2 family protein [Actinomycetota bacterium]